MTTVPIIDFPVAPPGTMGPPVEYAELRADHPIVKVRMPLDNTDETPTPTPWFVTRYADVRALLADSRLVRPTINDWPERRPDPEGGGALVTMMELDGPRHTALRQAVASSFSAGAVRDHLPRIRALADDLLADLRAGGPPGDLVAAYTEPFPLLVMCDLVGIPPEEADQFLPVLDAGLDEMVTPEEAGRTAGLLRDYVGGLIARKRANPGRDILSHLVAQWQAGALTHEDVVVFGLSMVASGFVTSSMFLSNAVLVLLGEPERYAELRDDRELVPAAVEELLRFIPALNGTVLLLATADVPLGDHVIAEGDAVVLTLAAANRDNSVFPDADRFDPRRAVNPHLVFGRGTHNCFGAHLARAELAVGLGALLDAFPGLRLADTPTWDDESPSKSPLTLPVSW